MLKSAICLAVFALLSPLLHAATVQRGDDFRAVIYNGQANAVHSGMNSPEQENLWSYFYSPNFNRFRRGKELDWASVVKHAAPIDRQNFKLIRNNFVIKNFEINADNLKLYWNRNAENPQLPELPPAFVIKYTIPTAGSYSWHGVLNWMPVGNDIKEAYYCFGTETANGKFTPLASGEFRAAKPTADFLTAADADRLPALQNLSLQAGDKLVLIVTASRHNYRGFTVSDDKLTITSPAIPTLTDHGAAAMTLIKLKGKYPDFTSFKSALARHMAKAPVIEKFNYWLFTPANADELLAGKLTTSHYGYRGITTHDIGKPGNINWIKFDIKDYDVTIRDIATLQWTNKLAEAYVKTGDAKYLKGYIDTLDDFASNWYPAFQKGMRDPEIKKLEIAKTLNWSAHSRLYYAWRLEVFNQGLSAIFQRAAQDRTLDQIDNAKFANILNHIVGFEMPRAINFLNNGGGAPNQQLHLIMSAVITSVLLKDFPDAPDWRKTALKQIDSCGYLADGSDMEQSFNYNWGLPTVLNILCTYSNILPESERGGFGRVHEMIQYRNYLMLAARMPNQLLPIVAKNNNWRYYKKDIRKGVLLPNNDLPLTRQFKKGETPAFQSIYWPYGGYIILRDGWNKDAFGCFMKTSRPGRGHMTNAGNALQLMAFNQLFLVSPGGEMYDLRAIRAPFNTYFYDSQGQSTVAVDRMGQNLRLDVKLPEFYADVIPGMRFHHTGAIDFAEGLYQNKYGTKEKSVSDVKHLRQLFLLKRDRILVVVDTLSSPAAHEYSINWHFDPDFSVKEVAATDFGVTTAKPGNPNLAIYQNAAAPIHYEQLYGVNTPKLTAGWVGWLQNDQYTPSVEMRGSFQGVPGQNRVISILTPYEKANPVKEFKRIGTNGAELLLANGRRITVSAGDRTVVTTPESRVEITDGEAFEKTADGKVTPIQVPAKFKWVSGPAGDYVKYQ